MTKPKVGKLKVGPVELEIPEDVIKYAVDAFFGRVLSAASRVSVDGDFKLLDPVVESPDGDEEDDLNGRRVLKKAEE